MARLIKSLISTGTGRGAFVDIEAPDAGIGYVTAQGAAVTQTSTRATAVTCHGLCGVITGDATSLAAEASATFVVTNSFVAIGDVVVLSVRSGPTSGATDFRVSAVAAGSFSITAQNGNASGGTADTGAPVINFAVIKTGQA